MISADDLVNWGFTWLLTGSVIWALMQAGGMVRHAIGNASRFAQVMVCLGAIVGWPIIIIVFVAGYINGMRGRVRS
jgi:hypothetical protein